MGKSKRRRYQGSNSEAKLAALVVGASLAGQRQVQQVGREVEQ